MQPQQVMRCPQSIAAAAVSCFSNAVQVSDLDGTMVGNGAEADSMTSRFTQFWEDNAVLRNSVLVYNTGRSLGQFTSLYQEKANALALPNVLITAVGTKVTSQHHSYTFPTH